jgi:hypothetical protein
MYFITQNIGPMLIIGAAILIAGGLVMYYTNILQRFTDWLKPDSDKFISAKVFCEDKQIRDRRLKVGRYVISDIKKHRSFYLVHALLLSLPGSKRGVLALTERNARPIDFQNKVSEADWAKFPSAQTIFIDTTADIRSESAKDATTNFMGQSLSIMALCAAIIVAILGVIIFVQGNQGGVS